MRRLYPTTKAVMTALNIAILASYLKLPEVFLINLFLFQSEFPYQEFNRKEHHEKGHNNN